MRILFVAAILVSLMVAPISSIAGWKVKRELDPINDEETVYGAVSASGSTFFIYQSGDLYRGGFIVGGDFETIHYEPKIITLRIDKNAAHNIDVTAWEPKRIYFYLSAPVIDEIRKGNVMLLRYQSSSTQSSIRRFTLMGSSAAIKAAYPKYDPQQRKADELQRKTEALVTEQEKARKKAIVASEKAAMDGAMEKHGGDYELAQDEIYSELCPEAWEELKQLERESGRPQLWRGCP